MGMQLIAAISLLVSMGKFVIYAKIENQKSSDVAQKKPILTFKHPNQYNYLIYKEKTVISDGLYSVAGVAGSSLFESLTF